MAKTVVAACIDEDVLAEQYGPLNNTKKKNKTEANSSTNPKPAQNHNEQASKNGDNNKRKRNDNGYGNRIGITNHCVRTARGDRMGNEGRILTNVSFEEKLDISGRIAQRIRIGKPQFTPS